MPGAPKLRATDAGLARKHTERVVKSLDNVVFRSRLSVDIRRVRNADGTSVHNVLLGLFRRPFVHDSDARRAIFKLEVHMPSGAVETWKFPVQVGTVLKPAAGDDNNPYALTPVGCDCKDWKYRGTDSKKPGEEGLRSASFGYRSSIRAPDDRLMGALRGCKHMIAVKRWMQP